MLIIVLVVLFSFLSSGITYYFLTTNKADEVDEKEHEVEIKEDVEEFIDAEEPPEKAIEDVESKIKTDLKVDEQTQYFKLYSNIDDFALVTIGDIGGPGGAWFIIKNEDGLWSEKTLSQGDWNCEDLFSMNITPEQFELLLEGQDVVDFTGIGEGYSFYDCDGQESYLDYYLLRK